MVYRYTLRKVEILNQLQQTPAGTTTELSERLNVLQPSISRSLHTLKKQGLIYCANKKWYLTKEGRTETDTGIADKIVMQEITNIVKSLTRIQKIMDSGTDLANIALALNPVVHLIRLLYFFAKADIS